MMQDIAHCFTLQNTNGLSGGFRGTVLGGIGEEKGTTPGYGKRTSLGVSDLPRRSMMTVSRAVQSVSYGIV